MIGNQNNSGINAKRIRINKDESEKKLPKIKKQKKINQYQNKQWKLLRRKEKPEPKKDKDVERNLRKKLQSDVVLILAVSSNNKNYKSFKDGNRLGKTS